MKGEVVYLYAFDVANEIVIKKAKELITNEAVPFEISSGHTVPKDAPLYKPLSIEIAPTESLLTGENIRPFVHIYEIGVISIALRVSFSVKNTSSLLSFHKPILTSGQNLSQIANGICSEICESIKDAMVQSSVFASPEAYTVFCLKNIETKQTLNNWLKKNHQNIAELLTGNKPGILSDMQVNEVMRMKYSYTNNDATIIDWDAALVIDLSGYIDDVIYVLELANLQLEEYLVMDKRLDGYLNMAYDDIKRHKVSLFGSYPNILRTLRMLRVDVIKLNEEVTNITKFFGDWYLARVYLGAHERFHLEQWRNSVAERLRQIDGIYNVVHSEITNFRMLWLEVLIVVFFAIDLIMMFYFQK